METAAHPRFLFKPRTFGMMFVTLTSSASLRTGVVKTFRCAAQMHIKRNAEFAFDDRVANCRFATTGSVMFSIVRVIGKLRPNVGDVTVHYPGNCIRKI